MTIVQHAVHEAVHDIVDGSGWRDQIEAWQEVAGLARAELAKISDDKRRAALPCDRRDDT